VILLKAVTADGIPRWIANIVFATVCMSLWKDTPCSNLTLHAANRNKENLTNPGIMISFTKFFEDTDVSNEKFSKLSKF
jgi:hypothetical protein